MKRLTLLLMVVACLCPCGKNLSVSDKYVGDWEGIVYAFANNAGDKMLVVRNVIELNIDESSSYTCILDDFQSPTGIPVKVGEGSVSKSFVIEEEDSISFSRTFSNNTFTSVSTSNGFQLESSEYVIELRTKGTKKDV